MKRCGSSWRRKSNGPMADALMWTSKIGWKWKTPNVLLDEKGQEMDLLVGPPVVLKQKFRESFQEAELQAEMRKQLEGIHSEEAEALRDRGVWAELARQFYHNKSVTVLEKRIFRALWTKSYVTGQTLHKWGYKCHGRCLKCNLGKPDTIFHRAWECPPTR